jgi:outer membrane protein assembly factor BamA
MRLFRFKLLWLILFCVLPVLPMRAASPPLVRSWTIREVGNYKKIPTATLRAKMAQRGVLFGVNEPYDQSKVDGATLLLKQVYKDAGVLVTVHPLTISVGPSAVKVEYVVNKQ